MVTPTRLVSQECSRTARQSRKATILNFQVCTQSLGNINHTCSSGIIYNILQTVQIPPPQLWYKVCHIDCGLRCVRFIYKRITFIFSIDGRSLWETMAANNVFFFRVAPSDFQQFIIDQTIQTYYAYRINYSMYSYCLYYCSYL